MLKTRSMSSSDPGDGRIHQPLTLKYLNSTDRKKKKKEKLQVKSSKLANNASFDDSGKKMRNILDVENNKFLYLNHSISKKQNQKITVVFLSAAYMNKMLILLISLSLLKVVTYFIKSDHDKERVVIQQFYLDEQERKELEHAYKFHYFAQDALGEVSLSVSLVDKYRNTKNLNSSKRDKLQTLYQEVNTLIYSTQSVSGLHQNVALEKYPQELHGIIHEEMASQYLSKIFKLLILEEENTSKKSFRGSIDTIIYNKRQDSLLIKMSGFIISPITKGILLYKQY